MKRLFRYLMFAALTLCAVGFASCSDDDKDDDDDNNGLTGSKTSPEEISGNKWVINWNQSKAYASLNGVKGETDLGGYGINGLFLTEIEFYSNGTMDCAIDTLKSKGSYTIDGFDFTATYDFLIHKTESDFDGSVEESDVRTSFTFKKGADISDCLYAELGVSEYPMSYKMTDYQISKSGDKLFITMIVSISYNVGNDVDSSEFGDFGNMYDNLMKQKNELSYYLVYNKK